MTESPRPRPVMQINNPRHAGPVAGDRRGRPRAGRSWRRAMLGTVLGAMLATACGGEPTAPAEPVFGTLGLRSVFAEGERPDELRLAIDSVHVVLTRTGVATPVVDVRAAFTEGATLSWVLELARVDEPLNARVELRGGSELLYTATATLTATAPGGVVARDVMVRYVGPPRAMAIVFSPDTAVLTARGESRAIRATALGRGGDPLPGKSFTWISSDTAVATVDADGRVTAVSEGVARVSAVVDGLASNATVTVAVVASAERSALDAAPASRPADDASLVELLVTLNDANGNPTGKSGGALTLASSIGTLSAVVDHGDGTYTATLRSATAGIATVSATLAGSPLADTALVEFTRPPSVITALEVAPSSFTLSAIGSTRPFLTTVRDQFGDPMTAVAVTWVSSDPAVATVHPSSGLVTAVADGTAEITATVTDQPTLSVSRGVTVRAEAAPARTTIAADRASAIADGTESVALTVRLFDALDHALVRGGDAVAFRTTVGTITDVVDRGDGSYTARLTSLATGTAVVGITVNGVDATAQATVEFLPIPRVLTRVEIAPADTRLRAIGATRTLSAVARDQFGDAMSGIAFRWSSSGAAVSVADAPTTAPVSVTAVANGEVTVTATAVDASGLAAQVAVVVAQVASVARSTISATPASRVADGTSAATVLVTLVDSLGTALPRSGGTVTMLTDRGTLSAVTDHGDGTYTATITSGSPGLATITASLAGVALAAGTSVTFTPVPRVPTAVVITSSPAPLDALGATTAYTALVRDQFGEPMPAAVVSWQSGTPAVASIDAASGLATAVANGVTTIRATVVGAPSVVATASLTVAQRASMTQSTIAASRDTIIADGTTASAITLTLRDRLGVRLAAGGTPVALATSAGTLTTVTDLGDGRYGASLTGTTVAQAVVSATVDGQPLAATAAVTIVRVPPFASAIAIVSGPSTLDALGADGLFTAVVRDQYGDPMPGSGVTWQSTAPGIAAIDAVSGAVTAVANGSATITVRVAGNAGVTASATLAVAQRASTTLSTLAASRDSIVADGTAASTLTLTLRDRLGVRLAAGGSAVTMATTAGTLSGVTDLGDGRYTATLTSTVVAQATITATVGGEPLAASAGVTVTRVPPAPASVAIVSGPAAFDAIGATGTFAALVRDQYGDVMPGVAVRWTSGDAAVATIDAASGLATAGGNGTTTITASVVAAPGLVASAGLAVAQRAAAATSSFTASRDSIIADGAAASALTLTLRDRLGVPLGGGRDVVMTTTAGDLTAVVGHEDGRYTATLTSTVIARATIVATVDGERVTDPVTVEITRIPPVVASVVVTPGPVTIRALGAVRGFSAVAYEADGQPIPGVPLAWSTDAPGVASVDAAGVAVTTGNGVATITATAPNGVQGSSVITVQQHAVTMTQAVSCTRGAPSCELEAFGDTLTLTNVVRDSLDRVIADAPVAFTSSDPAIATVTAGGIVVATGNGSAVITAEVEGLTTQYTVVVRQRVTFIKLTPIELWLYGVGSSGTVTAAPMDRTNHPVADAAISWAVGDATSEQIEVTGPRTVRVTALKLGESKLFATSDGVTYKIIVRIF